MWVDPNNSANKYFAIHADDANVPAGYVLQSGSDGSDDRAFQTYKPGAYSGGFPAYGTTNEQGTYGGKSGLR